MVETDTVALPRIKPEIIDDLREWAAFEQDGGNAEQGVAIDAILDWYDRWLRVSPAVNVKPLEWVEDGDQRWKAFALVASYHIVAKPDGTYRVRTSWSVLLCDRQFYSLAEAKAAAQADYEKLILSAVFLRPSK